MVILRADKVKEWLDLSGRSQSYLAESCGVSDSYISQLMNGVPCSGDVISDLLRVTRFDFEALFTLKENNIGENHPRKNYGKFRQKWQKER